jgi:hypothetical protein
MLRKNISTRRFWENLHSSFWVARKVEIYLANSQPYEAEPFLRS